MERQSEGDNLKGFGGFNHTILFCSIFGFTIAGIFIAYFEKLREEEAAGASVPVEKNQMQDVFLGSRRMAAIPVAFSLIGSYITGQFVLFAGVNIYYHGSQYLLRGLCMPLSSVVVAYVFLPVFQELQVTSCFEYLEIRFASFLRSTVAVLFVLNEVHYLALLVHIPATYLNQMTGLNMDLVSFVMNAFVVIYVLIGGMRAVIHTATCQLVLIMLAVLLIVMVGTVQIGGPQTAFKAAHEGGRLKFNFSPALTEYYTVWNVLIGSIANWTAHNVAHQAMVQLYMSVGTLRKAKQAIWGYTIGTVLFFLICSYSGLLVYEKFHDCDPLSAGAIDAQGQLLPHYVMEAHGKLSGIPGFFAAAVFAAVISSSSLRINCTALIITEDICKGLFKLKLSEKRQMLVYKLIIVALGASSFILIWVFELLYMMKGVLNGLLHTTLDVSFGIFTLGMLVPWANTYGTLIGAICGILFSGIEGIGNEILILQGRIANHWLPLGVSGCAGNVTIAPDIDDSAVFPLFRLSSFIHPVFGILTTITVGTIASFIIGKTDLKTLDARLISPVLRRFLPAESFDRK